MEDIEVSTEHLQDEMHERVSHSEVAHSKRDQWNAQVALTSAILAVFAAVSSLVAGHHSNEAMIEQIQASDHWSYYQAKGIKAAVLGTQVEILGAVGKLSEGNKTKDLEKLAAYKNEQEQISEKAKEKEAASAGHLKIHHSFAKAVTLFQVGIALAAISVLTRKRRFWLMSLGLGVVGAVFFVQGFFV